MISTAIIDQVKAARTRFGMSSGEVVAIAIQSVHQDLERLLRGPRAGASLFETVATRLPQHTQGPEAPLSYRLTQNDLQLIDDLCAKHGARSRGHLIATALEEYFKRNPLTKE